MTAPVIDLAAYRPRARRLYFGRPAGWWVWQLVSLAAVTAWSVLLLIWIGQ